jgi:hypothetical protein
MARFGGLFLAGRFSIFAIAKTRVSNDRTLDIPISDFNHKKIFILSC